MEGNKFFFNDKRDQLERLNQYYANPASLRGEQDPHRYLGQRAANTFTKDGHTMLYEGTIIAYNEGNGCYGVAYDDGDFESNNADVIKSLIEKWLVKTGQTHASARIQAARHLHSCCFTLIHSSARLLCEERSLFSQHTKGRSFELRDYQLPTSSRNYPSAFAIRVWHTH